MNTGTTNTDTKSSNVAAAVEAVERLAEHEVVELRENAVLVLPAGKKVHDLKPFLDGRRTAPERRKGTANLTTLESFIAHARRFADTSSVIFAVDDPSAPRLVSILDYHEDGHDGAPRFGEHRGAYAFPLSDEWKAWSAVPAIMDQGVFASFLEERIGDVIAPAGAGEKVTALAQSLEVGLASPATLLELSRGLSVKVDVKVAQHVNLGSGESKLVFEESHQAEGGGPLKVPGGFAIRIPVFRGGPLYEILVRLTYRVRKNEGRVAWALRKHRADLAFAHAFAEAAETAHQQTGLPLFYGTPE